MRKGSNSHKPLLKVNDCNQISLGQGHADGASKPSSYRGDDRVAHIDILADV